MFKKLLMAIVILFTPFNTYAAIAFDAASTHFDTGTTGNTSHTTAASSNMIMFAGILGQKGDGAEHLTSVTYNGSSMTKIASCQNNVAINISLWYLVAPSSGTYNVVSNFNTSMDAIYTNVVTYSGASQTGVPDAQTTNGPTVTSSLTTSLTTIADNSWIVGYSRNEAGGFTAGANTTLRNASNDNNLSDTNGAQTPAGSHSITMNPPSSTTVCTVAASFAPAAAAIVYPGQVVFFGDW